MIPTFLLNLSEERVNNVFLTGCGGGFDFVHSMIMVKDLYSQKKNVIIGSYSFGRVQSIIDGEEVFRRNDVYALKVCGTTRSLDEHYKPEILLCQYLDREYPHLSPHYMYAYYARDFSISILREFYEIICAKHNINAIVSFDGGSDSLMLGDEDGLGDPIEDAVSIGAISSITDCDSLIYRFLICIGLGADRFNDVSDASSLRAIAELTRAGAFRGSIGIEPTSNDFKFYKEALRFIYENQSFESVLASVIVCSTEGAYGSQDIPEFATRTKRIKKDDVFFWPISAMLFAFDIQKVADRSKIVTWLSDCNNEKENNNVFDLQRQHLFECGGIRSAEELPRHNDYSFIKKMKDDTNDNNIECSNNISGTVVSGKKSSVSRDCLIM